MSLIGNVLTAGRGPGLGATSTERTATTANPRRPRFYGAGRMRGAGQIEFRESSAAGDLWRVIVFDCGPVDGIEYHLLNNEALTLDADGWVQSPAKWQDKVRILVHLGADDQAADAALMAAFPGVWTSDHRLRGLSYVVVQQKPVPLADVNAAYPRGPLGEEWNAVARRSSSIYDPRDASTGYSENPVLQLLWVLMHPDGGQLALSDFDLPAWEAAADLCDADEAQPGGGVAPRYRAAGQFEAGQPLSAVNGLLQACNARVYLDPDADGKIGIVVDRPEVNADAPFTAADVISVALQPGAGLLDDHDATQVAFNNPELGFQDDVTPPWPYYAGNLVANGGFATDLTGWTSVGAGSASVSGAALALDATGGAIAVHQDVTVHRGRAHAFSFTVASACGWKLGTPEDDDAYGSGASSAGAVTASVTPAGDVVRITLHAASGTADADTVSLVQAPPERAREVTMPWVPARTQAFRLAKFAHLSLGAELVAQVEMGLAGYLTRPADLVTFDLPEMPAGGQWMLDGEYEMGPSDAPGVRFDATLLDDRWGVFDGAAELSEQVLPPATDAAGALVADPAGVRAGSSDAAGTVRVLWAAPAAPGVSAQVEWAEAGTGDWQGRVTVTDATDRLVLIDCSGAAGLVDVRVRFLKLTGGVTDWVSTANVNPDALVAAESAPTISGSASDIAVATIPYAITPASAATVWKVRLLVDDVQVAEAHVDDAAAYSLNGVFGVGTYEVSARTVNVSGVLSAESTVINLTVVPDGA